MTPLTLLVVAHPASRYLAVLDELPESVRIVVGNQPETFRQAGLEAGAILNCFQPVRILRYAWDVAPNVRWVHSLSVGVDNSLFPELVSSPVPLTNSRGIFSNSLAEFTLGGCLFFAKRFRRLVHNQEAGRWEQFDNEELRGKVIGIVGFGSIGQAVARLARAFGMRVLAVRKRPGLSLPEPLAGAVYGHDGLGEVLPQCDFVVAASPLTPETRGLLGEPEFRAMKPSAVFVNVGRGPVVDEAALIRALEERWIHGAALDVFEKEPLPDGHPFYQMEHVLLSPHCADHSATWLQDAMQCFLRNFRRFASGLPLENLVDKQLGY